MEYGFFTSAMSRGFTASAPLRSNSFFPCSLLRLTEEQRKRIIIVIRNISVRVDKVGHGIVQVVDGRIIAIRESIRLGSKILHLLPQSLRVAGSAALGIDNEIQIGVSVNRLFQILIGELIVGTLPPGVVRPCNGSSWDRTT